MLYTVLLVTSVGLAQPVASSTDDEGVNSGPVEQTTQESEGQSVFMWTQDAETSGTDISMLPVQITLKNATIKKKKY